MIRLLLPLAVLALASCGPRGVPAGQPRAGSRPGTGAYEAYLATNPDPTLVLSREDAQARALLGCGQLFAPGTIDAALAEAYGPLCEEGAGR